MVRVEHDHIHLVGFTIDGLDGDPSQATSYHRSLLEVRSYVANEGVQDFVGRNLVLRNALRHCVAFRYFTEDSELESSTIENCGFEAQIFGGTSPGYGIAIGTSPSSLDSNPTPDPDASVGNRVRNNSFAGVGVCVRAGEAANETLIENNTCRAAGFPTLAGIDLRSNSNIVRGNEIFENDGAGIRVGGATPADGTMNVIRDNTIRDNLSGGIRFQNEPQSEVCGNVMSGNQGGNARGAFGANFDPTAPCP